MAGSDLPPSGSGDTPPNGNVPPPGTSRKRKRGAATRKPVRVSTRSSSSREAQQAANEATVDEDVWLQRRVTRRCQAVYVDAHTEEVLPRRVPRSMSLAQLMAREDTVVPPRRRATRSSASSSRQAVHEITAVDAVRLARSVAVGTPWNRRGVGVEVERMREMILRVRQTLSVNLEPDDPNSPYAKKRKIYRSGSRSSQRLASQIRNLPRSPDPVEHPASDENAASEEDTADYKSETFLQNLGTEAGNKDVDTIDEASDENAGNKDVDTIDGASDENYVSTEDSSG